MIQRRTMHKPRLLKLPLVLAGALITITPLIGDLCQGLTHPGAPALFLSAAHAGENDLFAETFEQVVADIDNGFKNAEAFLARGNIRSTRQQISLLNLKIEKNKKRFSRDEKKSYKNRLDALAASVKRTVDSLVGANVEIVEKQGPKAGYEFRQTLSGQKGLSETDLAPVDEAIVERGNYDETQSAPEPSDSPFSPPVQETVISQAPAQPQETAAEEPAPKEAKKKKALLSFSFGKSKAEPPPPAKPPAAPVPQQASPDTEQSIPQPVPEPVPEPVVQPAPKPAPDAQASREDEKNRTAAIAHATKVRSLLDAGKNEEAKTVFRIYQQQIQRYLAPDLFTSLKTEVDTAAFLDQRKQTQATEKTRNIERLLEANRTTEAFAELRKSQDLLKQYLHKDEFKALDKKVNEAYMNSVQRQLAANQTMRSIRDLLAAKQAEKAYSVFDAKQTELKTGLSREAFDGLRRDVVAANNAVLDKKKRCEFVCRDIISLMRAGNGPAAYQMFNENAPMLRQYLDQARVSGMASDVTRAQEAFYLRQRKAQAMAFSIDSLIDRPDLEAAHNLFEETKERLRTDLADDKRFFELRDRLTTAYNELLKQQRAAARTAQEIEYLARQKEGRKAYDLFQQESASLRKYSAPEVFSRLESTVSQANADYSLRATAAQRTANEIRTLLDQNRVEQAYVKYQNSKNELDFYLGADKTVETLGKQAQQAYKSLQSQKEWAEDQTKQIRRLIEKQKGKAARAQFVEQRSKIAKYSDPRTIEALDAETDRANRAFEAAADRARQKVTRILQLLSQNQVEEAYDAFNSDKTSLNFYLEPAEFESLQSRVDASNSALKGKKSEALRIIKTIDGYIAARRGDSALLIFRQNEGTLEEYLTTQTFKGVAGRAAEAKNDYEKNCRTAEALEGKLYGMINRDKTLDANETFNEKTDFLKTFLSDARFERLKTAVGVSQDRFMAERKKARSVVSVIKRMIRQNQGVEAQAEFNRNENTLSRYLPSTEYLEIVGDVTQAYNSTVQGRQEAREAKEAINDLLKKEEFAYAYTTFKEMRSTLEQYMTNSDFTALETEVTYAWDEQEKRIKQAREYAKALKQLVAKDRIASAYKAFRQHRQSLAKYLDAETFADLESTIVDAYKKSWARARRSG